MTAGKDRYFIYRTIIETTRLFIESYFILEVFLLTINQTSKVVSTTSASITTSSVQFIGLNAYRLAFYIWNNSANSIYVTFGSTSSSVNPTVIIPTFATYVSNSSVCYTGPISGIRNAGSGNVTITELISS